MNRQERNKAKDSIVKSIEETQKDILTLKELTKPISPENAIGRVSRMDAINNKSVNEAALREALIKLVKLETVFSQLNRTDFGICINCKKNIPFGRLMIRPESQLCIDCAK